MLYRIESTAIALDACTLLDLDIEPTLALEAITKDSVNTDQHGEEQVGFQGGMGRNYERLEFLGDSFLKTATTISLFTLMPQADECESHVERMLLICNRNLFNHAVDRNLHEYVRSNAFDRRTWYPTLTLKRGKAPKAAVTHSLADKSIADVCEALIGAAYRTDMDLAVKAVSKMVRSKNHAMTRFSDYLAAYNAPEWQSSPSTAAQRFAVDAVEAAIGYRFSKPALLRSAFKHPSYPYEHDIPHYQRLEFLGDALLDLAVVDYLYTTFPEADPKWMTEHKMAMVSNNFFACVCVELGLHKHLTTTTSAMIGDVASFARELEQAKKSGQSDYWTSFSSTPKALSDIVEALVAAMFEDSGFDYSLVTRFFTRHILPYFENMDLYDTYVWSHPVAVLMRLMNERGCTSWRVCVSSVPADGEGVAAVVGTQVVCALMVHQKAFVHAVRPRGREAKTEVGKMALKRLRGLDRDEFREVLGCNC